MSSSPAPVRKRVLAVTVPTVAALLATTGIVALAGPAGAQQPSRLVPQLPDLTQDLPRQISVVPARRNGRPAERLTFRSAAENHGDQSAGGGFLVVVGRRTSPSAKTMVADQYVDMFSPTTGRIDTQEVHRNVGSMTFERGGGHSHWHLKGFERYELRNASGKSLVAPDRKTGFCVGNRYSARKRAPSPAPAGSVARRGVPSTSSRVTYQQFDGGCNLNKPGAMGVITGMNPSTGDDYKPILEGQYIDVTKVRSGRYLLVHRVNPTRKLAETNYTNNASSVLLQIRNPRVGKTTVRTLARCPGTDKCAPKRTR